MSLLSALSQRVVVYIAVLSLPDHVPVERPVPALPQQHPARPQRLAGALPPHLEDLLGADAAEPGGRAGAVPVLRIPRHPERLPPERDTHLPGGRVPVHACGARQAHYTQGTCLGCCSSYVTFPGFHRFRGF